MTIKELKKGDYFTKKSIEYPKDSQVWVKGNYDRVERKYECYNFADVNRYCYIPGNKEIFIDFIF